jgi:hypothetical protein
MNIDLNHSVESNNHCRALKLPHISPEKWAARTGGGQETFAEALEEARRAGEATRAGVVEETPGPEEAEETRADVAADAAGETTEKRGGGKGGRLSEVSLNDPWPPDHPLRGDCDRFLEIFKETYQEVLGEMGLRPESGDSSSVIMSNREFKEMVRRMAEKLNANPEAKELMAALNVDCSEPQRGEAFGEGARLIFEMWRQRHQEAVQAGEKDPGLDFKDFHKPGRHRNIELPDFWQDTH